jgi:fibronectin type III domain protein
MKFKKSALVAVPVVLAGAGTASLMGVANAATSTPSVSTPAVTEIGTDSATIHWTASSGTQADIQVYTQGTNQEVIRETVNGSSLILKGLSAGTAYDVRASAVKGGKAYPWTATNLFITKAEQGPQGDPGPQGDQGPAGQQGPSGVVSTGTNQLVSSSQGDQVQTGGSFSKRSTEVGSVQLDAGTYLINVNAVATPDATTSGDVFPQLEVYQAQFSGSNWSDDLFNVGNGAIENPTATELSQGNLINGFLSASDEVTVPAGGETLYLYAFGYDTDQGEGTYTLNSATVTATKLQTSS